MGIRPVHFAIVVLLVPASAGASGHNFDVSAGWSRIGTDVTNSAALASVHSGSVGTAGDDVNTSKVYGWHFVAARTFHRYKLWGVAADVSGHFHEDNDDRSPSRRPIQQLTFMLGPRWETPPCLGKGIARVMLHALPFGFRLDNQDSGGTAMVAALGASLELKRHSTPSGIGLGVTYDRFWVTGSGGQNRFSVLLTRRFID
jgi:hypothetical protein